ncbi:MAG: AMMECR1 domain-containing protein, partial [Halanaerobium sp.]|nr:AMMECR1 domain-containing protein [Halanaerobium sp.]
AGFRDPRFMPITRDELPELDYSVDILSRPEKISGLEELDVERFGVIVKAGARTGLLLPDLEGVDTVEEQVDIARRKAGIPSWEDDLDLYRFEVKRYR